MCKWKARSKSVVYQQWELTDGWSKSNNLPETERWSTYDFLLMDHLEGHVMLIEGHVIANWRSCHANWRTRWSTYFHCYFSHDFNTFMLALYAGSLCFDDCVQWLRWCIKWSLYTTEFLCSQLFVVTRGLVYQLVAALSEIKAFISCHSTVCLIISCTYGLYSY